MQDKTEAPGCRTVHFHFVDIPRDLAYIAVQLASMLLPKKSLGQNFLRDENIARKIVGSLHLLPEDFVLEIGPGQGDLTRFLLDTTPNIIGVELDSQAIGILRERFGSRLTLLEQDILTVSLADTVKAVGRSVCVVGNIPYYITSEILFWMYDQRSFISNATLTMQAEVAARLIAVPNTKAYGILSVLTQYYADARVLFRISRNSFHPRPEVDSAVVRFEFDRRLPDVNDRLFRNIVRTTFGTRRKTIRNGLRLMGFSEQLLDGIQADLKRRPEELALSDFISLSRLLEPYASTITMKF